MIEQENTKSISFIIPGGICIKAEIHGDANKSQGEKSGWSSADIIAEFPSGHIENLCCVDFEDREGNSQHFNRLRVMTFKPGCDDPCDILQPLPHRSIWISFDEGSYDINIWDEDANDRDSFFEIGHISSLEEAERIMEGIIKEHSFIWTIRELQIK